MNILMKKDGKPEGGKWSFDEDNRKKLPKNTKVPKFPTITETKHTKNIKLVIEKIFKIIQEVHKIFGLQQNMMM